MCQLKNDIIPSDKNQMSITDLPIELLQSIIRLLNLRDIFMLRSTCKKFYQLCSDKDLYNQLDLKPYWNDVSLFNFYTKFKFKC